MMLPIVFLLALFPAVVSDRDIRGDVNHAKGLKVDGRKANHTKRAAKSKRGPEDQYGTDVVDCDPANFELEPKVQETCFERALKNCLDMEDDCEEAWVGKCDEEVLNDSICKLRVEGELAEEMKAKNIGTKKGCCPKMCGLCTAPVDDEGKDKVQPQTTVEGSNNQDHGEGEPTDFQDDHGEGEHVEDDHGEGEHVEDEHKEESLKELEELFAKADTALNHEQIMKEELQKLDLMNETMVEELGKFDEMRCMFRCVQLAHRHFSDEEDAKLACECKNWINKDDCNMCQYLAEDKVKDEEGNEIEREFDHKSLKPPPKSVRGRCVLPGDVVPAVKVNYKGTVIQC